MTTINKSRYGNAHYKCVCSTPVDEFLFEESENGSVTRVSDIDMLLHQKSIQSKIGIDTFRQWAQGLSTNKESFDVSQYSDEQILTFVKSRYISSFSDLDRYAKQINKDAKLLKDDIERTNTKERQYKSYIDDYIIPKIKDKLSK